MSSFHTSFTYLNSNSSAEGMIVSSFSADSGEVDTYLSMEQIFTESAYGTHRNLYGAKYNSVATFTITLIKPQGADLTVADNRRLLRWLTGNRKASWLDLYAGDKLQYSFYCTVQNVQQYKIDARIVGLIITFESIHPWAWSPPQNVNFSVGDDMIQLNTDDGMLYKENSVFALDDNGILYNDIELTRPLSVLSGVAYNGKEQSAPIDNQSDDLYSFLNLDITYENAAVDEGCGTTFTISNLTLQEETTVNNISPSEVIKLNASQFITSSIPNKIFGDDFSGKRLINGKYEDAHFVFPRLAPGENELLLSSDGKGTLYFTYRYPIKIGDCAVNIDDLIHNPVCEGEISGAISSVDGITKLGRKNIILVDRETGSSYAISIRGGQMMFTEPNTTRKQKGFAFTNTVANQEAQELLIIRDRIHITPLSMGTKTTTHEHDYIILVDEETKIPYKVHVENDSLYFIEL